MKKNKNTIMIIEDDIVTQDLLLAFFRPKGYEVVIYDDAQKAYVDLENQIVECDIIIADQVLPSISGIEFTKKVKAINLMAPIILMTANKKVELAIEAIQVGAYDFVVKPLHLAQLLISVERAFHLVGLRNENSSLRTAVQLQSGAADIHGVIGKSPGFKHALDLANRVSKSLSSVLITGESGTGKEIIAKTIHNMSSRKKLPFIAINCSSIPENLLESELFGHSKGAFTGASDKRIGLFEEAEGGTVFLDEIGDLSQLLQAKLLRVLQERKIKRIGENTFRPINVRIISATHKNLRKEILDNRFREDLFFRLNVIPIWIPPLRERKEDIIPLAEFFLRKFSVANESVANRFSREALELLLGSPWPGNVRELENTVERAVVLSTSEVIEVVDLLSEEKFDIQMRPQLSGFAGLVGNRIMTIVELNNLYIQHVLKINQGAREKTAKDLDIDRKTLYRRLSEFESQTSASSP